MARTAIYFEAGRGQNVEVCIFQMKLEVQFVNACKNMPHLAGGKNTK